MVWFALSAVLRAHDSFAHGKMEGFFCVDVCPDCIRLSMFEGLNWEKMHTR